jgi:hypothetical protein
MSSSRTDADSRAAVGSLQQLVDQQASGGVAVPDVVLDIDAADRLPSCERALGERIHAIGHQAHARLADACRRRRRLQAFDLRARPVNR